MLIFKKKLSKQWKPTLKSIFSGDFHQKVVSEANDFSTFVDDCRKSLTTLIITYLDRFFKEENYKFQNEIILFMFLYFKIMQFIFKKLFNFKWTLMKAKIFLRLFKYLFIIKKEKNSLSFTFKIVLLKLLYLNN